VILLLMMALRFLILFLAAMAVLVPAGFAQEEPADDSLRIYAVNIIQAPPQSWTGYGVYLGNGLVITAAHVVCSAARTHPSVRVGGRLLRAATVKEGTFEQEDLTLLQIDESELPVSLRLRRMPVCQHRPWVGEPVIAAVPEGIARSHIMSPQLLPVQFRA